MHIKSIIKTFYRLSCNFLLYCGSRRRIRGYGNKIVRKSTACLYHCRFDIEGNDNVIEVAAHANLRNVLFYIRGNNCRVQIGHSVKINRGGEIWLEDNGTWISIGNGTSIEQAHLAATEDGRGIELGEDCMLSSDVDIRTGDSHSILNIVGERTNPAGNVIIGNHVWIAAHVSVLKGVSIPANCVVGTRSVVCSPPPPHISRGYILAGVPAKIIKENISWLRKRI